MSLSLQRVLVLPSTTAKVDLITKLRSILRAFSFYYWRQLSNPDLVTPHHSWPNETHCCADQLVLSRCSKAASKQEIINYVQDFPKQKAAVHQKTYLFLDKFPCCEFRRGSSITILANPFSRGHTAAAVVISTRIPPVQPLWRIHAGKLGLIVWSVHFSREIRLSFSRSNLQKQIFCSSIPHSLSPLKAEFFRRNKQPRHYAMFSYVLSRNLEHSVWLPRDNFIIIADLPRHSFPKLDPHSKIHEDGHPRFTCYVELMKLHTPNCGHPSQISIRASSEGESE